MGKVYRVYDSEWEEVMGEEQIREFAINQMYDKAEDFIEEAKEGYRDEEDGKALEVLFNKVDKEDYTDLTMEEIDLVFKLFDFQYEELCVR